MKYFFDTSVLVSVALLNDSRHGTSLSAYLRADPKTACCAAHSLAEIYATLTRLPGNHRLAADQALLFLDEIRSRLQIIALDSVEYYECIKSAVAEDIVGGTIYDMLLARCAVKVGAEVIYSWDARDFARLGQEIAKRVTTP